MVSCGITFWYLRVRHTGLKKSVMLSLAAQSLCRSREARAPGRCKDSTARADPGIVAQASEISGVVQVWRFLEIVSTVGFAFRACVFVRPSSVDASSVCPARSLSLSLPSSPSSPSLPPLSLSRSLCFFLENMVSARSLRSKKSKVPKPQPPSSNTVKLS